MLILSREEKAEVGARLRSLRADRTISVMADAYCVSSGYWSKLERGTGSNPSERLLMAIAKGEKVRYEWLAFGNGDRREGSEVREDQMPYRADDVVDEVVDCVYDILSDDETMEAVKTMAHKLGQSEKEVIRTITSGRVRR